MENLVEYIIKFLLYGNEEAINRVGYTADESQWPSYSVVIVPNGKLGKSIVYPDLSDLTIRDYGTQTKVIENDIIYTAFFFLSRAEEVINDQRDGHNRFIAHMSLLHCKNMLKQPLLDEYSRILLKLLNLPLSQPGFSHIYLTHDVDTLSFYRSLRGTLGALWRSEIRQSVAAHFNRLADPAFTFPWIVEQEEQVFQHTAFPITSIYFIKRGPNTGLDYPQYGKRDLRYLCDYLLAHHAELGYHSAYNSHYLHDVTSMGDIITQPWHRAHYLRCSIERMQYLIELGYTDDFTMGYPDEPGFRLQTTRPVQWINPYSYQVTPLTLHPLILMDTTLSDERYMNLNEDEAWFISEQLIDRVRQNHGELVLLWHNSNFVHDTYHKSLYSKIISSL